MGILEFKTATREGTKALISLYGLSGSGKTFSALLMGRGIVGPKGKLGLIDTESGRGRIYADDVPGGYEYAELTAPFSPERYIEAIDIAEAAGIECLIIDSGSHEWEGFGGVLEFADSQTSKNGKPLSGLIKWARPKADHKRFVRRLLRAKCHLIICLRAKEKMRQEGQGFNAQIISEGFVSVQEKSFIFDMTVEAFLPNEGARGIPRLEKCPGSLVSCFPEGEQISVKTGEGIRAWIESGATPDADFLDFKTIAEEVAEGGTEALKAWFVTLDESDKKHYSRIRDNLKSIAAEADKLEKQALGEVLSDALENNFQDSGEDVLSRSVPPEEESSSRTMAPAPSSESEPPPFDFMEWFGDVRKRAVALDTVEDVEALERSVISEAAPLSNEEKEVLRRYFSERRASVEREKSSRTSLEEPTKIEDDEPKGDPDLKPFPEWFAGVKAQAKKIRKPSALDTYQHTVATMCLKYTPEQHEEVDLLFAELRQKLTG